MIKPKLFGYYVTTCMDIAPSEKMPLTMLLERNGISKTVDFVKCDKDTVFAIEGMTPYMKDKILEFMDEYELHFGMTDEEILAYQDGEYFKKHPDAEPHYGNGLEYASKTMASSDDGSEDTPPADNPPSDEPQDMSPEDSKARKSMYDAVMWLLERQSKLKSEVETHEKKLSALEKKHKHNRELMDIMEPYEWESTFHSAAILCMAAQSLLTKYMCSPDQRAHRAVRDAEALIKELRQNTMARDKESEPVREELTSRIREERKTLKELQDEISKL